MIWPVSSTHCTLLLHVLCLFWYFQGSGQVSHSAAHSGSRLWSRVTPSAWADTAGHGLRPAGHREWRLQVRSGPLGQIHPNCLNFTSQYLIHSEKCLNNNWSHIFVRGKGQCGKTILYLSTRKKQKMQEDATRNLSWSALEKHWIPTGIFLYLL